MSKRDEYTPMTTISNTAPPVICVSCKTAISGVFYVRGTTTLCARCRP